MIACQESWAVSHLEIEDRWKEDLEPGTGQLRARLLRVGRSNVGG